MLGSFFDVSWWYQNTSQTDERIKESDQERQRNAEQVEDLQKQLSKAAAEACLHIQFLIVWETLYGQDQYWH